MGGARTDITPPRQAGAAGRRRGAGAMVLDVYEVAYLAAGPRRVAEVALLRLRERGVVGVVGPRVRAERPADGAHPVERALTGSCPRGRSVAAVLAAVADGPETAGIRDRLRAAGLLGRVRSRPTAAGRRRVAAARAEGAWPAYVFDGPPAVADRMLRRVVQEAGPVPSGLGRHLVRMGKALDRADHSEHGHGHGHDGGSCGGGGGGPD
ncbi:TIGR04222 domain-containing membrane protein [Streptomyces erythrochromogenes]|uniref:TIGR04222 domain-containing membrane protein n=1 Tax=Streptomyces erythrochromogenes TaxID=285574 RepID=UPI00370056F0